MATLVVPRDEGEPWPTLGPQVWAFLLKSCVHGPGDLRGQPFHGDAEKQGIVYRLYEVFPRGHRFAGRRRFKQADISVRKGTAKTELAAAIAFAELHPDGPVRCDGFDAYGQPVGRPVDDPFIPMMATTEDQVAELAYGALLVMCQEGPDADLFDAGLDRIVRLGPTGKADGKAEPVSTSPDSADGARTTFQHFDEPLALDTPVPTSAGWSTVGELQSGDEVFGRDGRPLRVLGASPVHVDRPCYRVTFRDGSSVVTDGGHRWKVVEWSNRPVGEQVVTTQQMLDRGLVTGYGHRWRIPRGAGVEWPERSLPIDPYLLGAWLGDGATSAGYLHSAPTDYREMSIGIEHTISDDARAGVVRWLPTGLRAQLRCVGLLGHKHIPADYATASRAQRIELLRGLMDTDGHTTRGGSCTFVQGRRELAEAVQRLVRSLGEQASLVRTVDERSRTGEMWKVHFSPSFVPFRLARKVGRSAWGARTSTWWPAVVSIDPVPSVPVRCIAVDSDDHLFVVGDGFTLTHNTHRLTLPRVVHAWETMLQNIPKRVKADAWSLGTTTTYTPGEGSVAQINHEQAEAIARGDADDPTVFFFHREAGPEHKNLADPEVLRAAIREASGPAIAAWDGFEAQVEGIARLYHQAKARGNVSYFERVWLNRRKSSERRAFDVVAWRALGGHEPPRRGVKVCLGLDGSRWRDGTGLVVTDLERMVQWKRALWTVDAEHPEIDPDDVDVVVDEVFDQFDVVRFYFDPAQGWDKRGKTWAEQYGPKRVVEFYTDSRGAAAMGRACRSYHEAIVGAELGIVSDEDFERHIGAACKRDLKLRDEDGEPLWTVEKESRDSLDLMDLSVCAVLSWKAALDAIKAGQRLPDEPEYAYFA